MPDYSSNNPWLVRYRPDARAGLRLICLPYAGGSAVVFRPWAEPLAPLAEVCAVQLPGRGSRLTEPPLRELPEIVEALADALRPCWQRPFAFFGHSMGALIAFELARRLRREGAPPPQILFVSGRRAPQTPGTESPTYELPDPEFIEHLRGLNGTPAELLANPELMQLMLPVLRADFAVCQTYAYRDEPPLECPISVFGGLSDSADRDQLEGWRTQTRAAFSLHMLPGDHFFLHSSRRLLLRTIAARLSQTKSATTAA
jgi:medium-chain acyl-[acyl-carrier-protein] hydrolase